jgi:hypothetical protein
MVTFARTAHRWSLILGVARARGRRRSRLVDAHVTGKLAGAMLQGFMRFYNFDRPHHGVRGRTPATIVFGARAVAR